ncbi:hypothetical protein Tco_0960551 [Tanacetum coccineum]
MTVSPILETIHEGNNSAKNVTKTPPATPLTKTKIINWKNAIMQRLTNLEQHNSPDVIQEQVQSHALMKLEINCLYLYEKMFLTAAYTARPKHHTIYDALQESMQINKLETRFGSTKPSHTKRTHDDQDPKDHEGEKSKKRRRKGAGESSFKKRKDQDVTLKFERGNDKSVKELPIQSWFNELVDAQEEPDEYEYKDCSIIVFGKLVKKIFKKDNIIKEDVDGPSFELLKGTCKNSIELEYNMNQFCLALTANID